MTFKNIIMIFIFLFCFQGNVYAVYSMDEANVKNAQEYGIMRYQEEIPVFAKHWRIFEESSKALDESSERAYIYTPYYLVALNARERLLASQPINLIDGQIALEAYHGSLPVCVVLYLENIDDLNSKTKAFLSQSSGDAYSYDTVVQYSEVVQTKVIREIVDEDIVVAKPITTEVNEKKSDEKNKDKKADTDDKKDTKTTEALVVTPEPKYIEKTVPALYRVQLFFYFDIRTFSLNGQTVLVVNYDGGLKKKFHFNFDNIK